jgi:hypothetical protein
MIVRIASVQVAPERIDEIVGRYRETVRPIHQHSDGLRNHYVLVNRQSGQMRLRRTSLLGTRVNRRVVLPQPPATRCMALVISP